MKTVRANAPSTASPVAKSPPSASVPAARAAGQAVPAAPVDRFDAKVVDWAAGIPARRPGGPHLEPFRSYYDESARLPSLPPGKTLITFDERQARCLHRLYWSLPPDTRFQELAELAAKQPEFRGRGEPVTTSQLERFFKRMPDSFPWSWEKRAYVTSSYAIVSAAITAPEGTAFQGVWTAARERHPNLYERKSVFDWTSEAWLKAEIPLPFIGVFERDGEGRYLVRGLGPRADIQRKGGRLVLDQALADRVAELGRDERVKYGWSVEKFCEFVSEQIGGGFTFNSYEALLGKPDIELPSWTVLKREAMGRLAKLVVELKEKRGLVSTGEMSRVLHEEHGYELFPRTQYEYLRRYFPEVPDFKAAKTEATRAEAQKLMEDLARTAPAQHFQIARGKGLDEQRAKYVVGVARSLNEDLRPDPSSSRRPYDAKEIALLRQACAEVPIGSGPADVYAWVARRNKKFAAERQLSEPRQILGALERHLGVSSMVEHEHRRLAELLAKAVAKKPRPRSFAELVRRARKLHPIAFSDGSLRGLRAEWAEHPRPAAVAHLVDELGRLPWDDLEPPKLGPILARFAEHYAASRRAPPATEAISAAKARTLHDLYWSAPLSANGVEDLLKLARARNPAGFARITPAHVQELMRSAPSSFPFTMRERRVAIHAMLFVEALAEAPNQLATSKLIQRLAERYEGFPSPSVLNELASGAARTSPKLYPFLAGLPRGARGEVLWQRPTGEPKLSKGKVLVVGPELARAVREVYASEEIRYDWDAKTLAEFVAKKLDIPFRKENIPMLAARFGAPTYDEIMRPAAERLAKLIARIAERPEVFTRADIAKVLHDEHGYPVYGDSRFDALGRELPGVMPDLRLLNKQKYLAQAESYLAKIKANGGRDIERIGREMGFTEMEAKHRLRLIHENWPDALPTRAAPKPYDDEDKAAMRLALDTSPLFASASEVLSILNAQSPRFAERHPLSSGVVFASAARRVLDHDWMAHNHARLRAMVADVCSRSRVGYSVPELHEQIRHEHDVRLGLYQFRMLLADWATNAERHPEIAKLQRGDGKFPWQYVRTPLTKELAVRVAAVMKAHKDWTWRQVAVELAKDVKLLTEHPNLTVNKLRMLRAKFPSIIPDRDGLEPAGKTLKAIGDRIRGLLKGMADARGATPLWIARQLRLEEEEVLRALRYAPSNFAQWNPLLRLGVDLPLAAAIAAQIERATLDTTPEQIVAALAAGPHAGEVDAGTLSRAAAAYPELVPEWSTRQRILESKMLVDALVGAPSGKAFADVVRELRDAHPGWFRVEAPEPWIAQWENDPQRYPFVEALRVRGKLRLTGHGLRVAATAENDESLASRLVRETAEIPEDLKMCREIAATAPKSAFENCEVLCIQHILGGQVPFFDILGKLGLSRDRCTIVDVPYSTNETVADVLVDDRWDLRRSPLDLIAVKETTRQALYERVQSAIASGRRVVVLDDGGHVADLLAHDPWLRDHAHLVSIVEQTRRGITVAEQNELFTALINAAQAWGKVLEGHLIGDNLYDKLMMRLERLGVKSLEGKRIGLIGNGVIGAPLAEALHRAGAIVTIRDTDDDAQRKAAELGFGDGSDKAKFFGGQDIIIGATGQCSMGPEEIALMKTGTLLASGTSKLVEISVETLAELAKQPGGRTEVIDAKSRPPTVRYFFPDGRHIDLMASGFPLNFDGAVNNLDVQKVQLTHALMLIGMLQAVRAKVAGFHHLELERQRRAVEHFGRIESVKRDDRLMEQVKLTDLRIREAQRGSGRADARAVKTERR